MRYQEWFKHANNRPAKTRLLVEALEDRLALSHTAAIVIPSTLVEGSPINLSSSVTGTGSGAVTYDWKITSSTSTPFTINSPNSTGTTFSFTPSDNGSFQVTLAVTDASDTDNDPATDNTHTVTVPTVPADLAVLNVAPTAAVTGPSVAVPNQALTFNLSATDPSSVDQAAGFTYHIDWGDTSTGTVGPAAASPSTTTHTFTSAGVFKVSVTAEDKNGGVSTTPATTIVAVSGTAVQGNDLVVVGTGGNDKIVITPSPIFTAGDKGKGKDKDKDKGKPDFGVKVLVNGVSQGSFKLPAGSIIVYGLDGNDNIQVAGSIKANTVLFGGIGNDRLNGGNGHNILVGGEGNDSLNGGNDNDILIGGTGKDQLNAGAGLDILIGGSTSVDSDAAALATIMTTWSSTSTGTYASQIAALTGPGTGLRLGGATVTDDAARDTLTGSAHLDWFLTLDTLDKLPGKHKSEQLNNP